MQSPLSREAMLALSRRGSIKCHDLQNPTFDTFSGKISNEIEETKATDKFAFSRTASICCPPCSTCNSVVLAGGYLGSWILVSVVYFWQYLQQIECNPEN